MYFPSKAVARNLGEEVLLDRPRPTTIKRERETVTSKTDLRDHMTEPGPLYRVIRNIKSWLIRSQVTQSSELYFNNNTVMIFMISTLVRPNVFIWFDNTLWEMKNKPPNVNTTLFVTAVVMFCFRLKIYPFRSWYADGLQWYFVTHGKCDFYDLTHDTLHAKRWGQVLGEGWLQSTVEIRQISR